jgi:hypothetical protein
MVVPSADSGSPRYWLIVERPANWQVDKARGFCSFAVTDRYRTAVHEMKSGDIIVTYVSRMSAFADVRRVCTSRPRQITGEERGYDRQLDWEIDTELVVALEPGHWLRVGLLVDELGLTRGKNWGPIFLTSLRRLDNSDGSYIAGQIQRRAASSNGGTLREAGQ